MKFLLKGHFHTKCSHLHNLLKEKEKEIEKSINDIKQSIRKEELDFQRGGAGAEP
jgi:hypothetical protein